MVSSALCSSFGFSVFCNYSLNEKWSMKLFLLFMLFSFNAYSCVIGPKQITVSSEFGFEHKVSVAEFYPNVDEIRIQAPLVHNGKKFSVGVFTVFYGNQLVSRSSHSAINEDGYPQFIGYVSNAPDFKYEVTFLYGEGKCKSYEFVATNIKEKS